MKDLITEARELCERATPGPWRTKDRGAYIEIHDNNTWAKALSPFAHVEGDESDNAAFIARSRTLIPELCDALEKANAEMERLHNLLAEAQESEKKAIMALCEACYFLNEERGIGYAHTCADCPWGEKADQIQAGEGERDG